jgi:hypothetical protein
MPESLLAPKIAPKINAQKEPASVPTALERILAGPSLREKYGSLVRCETQFVLSPAQEQLYTLFTQL